MKTSTLLLLIISTLLLSGCQVTGEKDKGGGGGEITDPVNPQPSWFGATAWHPNGQWIAAEHGVLLDTDDDGQRDSTSRSGIWLINATTGEIQDEPLLEWGRFPDWSPDGSQLVLHQGGHIYSVDILSLNPPQIDSTNIRQLTTQGRNFYPKWSPDGKWIAYQQTICNEIKKCGIWLYSLDNETEFIIAKFGSSPAWFQTRQKILYKTRAINSNGEAIGDSLWIFSLHKNKINFLKFLTGENNESNRFNYSPDGLFIAYLSAPPPPKPAAVSIWRMNSDGSNPQKISPDWSAVFSWRPDGKQLVFLKYNPNEAEEGNGQLWLMNPDGTGLRQFTHFNPEILSFKVRTNK